MPKIVILGSLRNGDFIVTAPKKVCEDYHNETGYQMACERFYPAIEEADIVIVYGDIGEHTQRDIDYAISKNKRVIRLKEAESLEASVEMMGVVIEEWRTQTDSVTPYEARRKLDALAESWKLPQIAYDNQVNIVRLVCHNAVGAILRGESLQNVVIFHLNLMKDELEKALGMGDAQSQNCTKGEAEK